MCLLKSEFVEFLSFLMCLSQSVVLWKGRGVYCRYSYLVKDQIHIMARTAQISKEKRQFLQEQSQKQSSDMMKLSLMRTATGKEDPELPLLQRISSSLRNWQLTASQIAAQIKASQSSSNRHISTSTVQRRKLKKRTPIRRRDLLGPRNTRWVQIFYFCFQLPYLWDAE